MKEYIIKVDHPYTDGMTELVRCKDCKYKGNKKKCILAFVADKQEFLFSFYDNNGKWFCADGKPKDGGQE